MNSLDTTAQAVAATGRETYGNWSEAGFETLVRGPATRLWNGLSESPASANALRAFLKLGTAALSEGLISATGEADGLLGHLWTELVPRSAASVPVEAFPSRLAELWNLCEGLRGDGVWLDRVVCRGLGELHSLADLEPKLEEVLESVFAEDDTPAWQRGQVEVLDCREALDAFLPGAMYLLAPRVLCVRDRRSRGLCLGVALGAEPELLGRIEPGEPFAERQRAPEHRFEWGALAFGEHLTYLPLLGAVHESLGVGAGYVAVSARNSQRLWVAAYV